MRAFTRKDGTTIFIKNDPAKQGRRRYNKSKYRLDDNEEVEVNLYKDADLEHFEIEEEAPLEQEAVGEFVLTLKRDNNTGLYSLV